MTKLGQFLEDIARTGASTDSSGTITRADVERAAKSLAEAGPAESLRGMRRAMAERMAASSSR